MKSDYQRRKGKRTTYNNLKEENAEKKYSKGNKNNKQRVKGNSGVLKDKSRIAYIKEKLEQTSMRKI